MKTLTLKQSLLNLRTNIPILVLLLILVAALIAINAPHNEMIWAVALLFVAKAESRPQPTSVVLIVAAATITSIIVLS